MNSNIIANDHAEKRRFYKKVFALVMPMALQNLINVAVNAADVFMLGMIEGDALPGASQAGQIQFVMLLSFFGLTSGAAVLTAQYWGKGDTRTIEKIMGITMRVALLVSVIFSVCAITIPQYLMRLYSPDEGVIAEGTKYLRIMGLVYPVIALTTVYLNIMRSIERVMLSTVVYSISLTVNITLNAVFIFGIKGVIPAMNITGAAIATAIARCTELVIAVGYDRWMRRTDKIKRKVIFRPSNIFVRDAVLFRDFMKYSMPVMANEILWSLGISVSAAIIGHVSTEMVTANSVTQVVRQLAMIVVFGIANATAIILGKTIGEGKPELAWIYSKRMSRLALITGCFGTCVMLAARPILLAVLKLTEAESDILSMMLVVMGVMVIVQALNTAMIVGIFRAGGDTRIGLVLDVGTLWGGAIILGSLAAFVFHWSVTVIYILLLSDELMKLPFTIWRYSTKKWLKNVTRDIDVGAEKGSGSEASLAGKNE